MRRRLADELAADGRGGRTVEGDRLEIVKIVNEMLDPVVLCLADRLVEAPAATCRRDYIPQPDAPLSKPLQPDFVSERLQILSDRRPEETPELVRRVSIVAPRGKRCVARKAAKDEQPRIAPRDRRKSEFDGHELTPTALPREADRPPRR